MIGLAVDGVNEGVGVDEGDGLASVGWEPSGMELFGPGGVTVGVGLTGDPAVPEPVVPDPAVPSVSALVSAQPTRAAASAAAIIHRPTIVGP
ncbi:hypothetical protein [Streptomyces sp. SID13031]|uniref:hypothetical protein n=1 Tax=Streptomyces sp. SID13031 TaxID=2706046 RepID=UPI0013CCFB1F|nr:hypothetical protein [Streptomyces sp. SID13031]NEA31706.1 hypothetical protein [Streptomyces sp. SID13031]